MKRSDKEYATIILHAAEKGISAADLAPELWESLYRDKSLNHLERIFDLSKKMLLEKNKQMLVRVESASQLGASELDDIKAELKSRFEKEILIEEVVDSKLGSGIKIIADDKILDFTSQSQIERLTQHIKQ